VFLTWCLHSSIPHSRRFRADTVANAGRVFAALDRLLHEARDGCFYLRRPDIARMVIEAFYYNAVTLGHYDLHAYAVMANHVHLLLTPQIALPKLTKSLKGITAKRANALLGLTGSPFWKEESYDRLVRNEHEFERIRNYIEQNPVRAGIVRNASEYEWSSAARSTRGSPADQGVRRT
jgi:putative transposase